MDSQSLVISKRIRLARNIRGMKFPAKQSREEADEVTEEVNEAFFVSKELKESFILTRLRDKSVTENLKYFENHLISRGLLWNRENGAFLYNTDGTVSIMINEEDHLRIQTISRDRSLFDLYREAELFDDLLEEKIQFAFDPSLGYLTASPTNLGTALRASVMLHLPALTVSDRLGPIVRKIAQMGMTIRGIYGEGSNAMGNIYQVSNEVTLGVSEDFILENIGETVDYIAEAEKNAQTKIIGEEKDRVHDLIFRSLGILKNARMIREDEALDYLSNVRIGAEHGLISKTPVETDAAITATRKGNLMDSFGLKEDYPEKNLDVLRATLLRQEFMDTKETL